MSDRTGVPGGTGSGRLGDLAHFTARHRWLVIGVWIVLTLFGGVRGREARRRAGTRALAIPGKPAYEASQRTLKALGVGDRPPNVVVFHYRAATRRRARRSSGDAARGGQPSPARVTSSYFSTGNPMYVSRDRHTTFQQVYPPGPTGST